MTTPAIHGLRLLFPQAHITLMARPSVADVFEANPDVDRLWTAQENASTSRFKEIASRVKAEKFDLGISLPNSFGAAVMMALGGVKRRIGYKRDARGLFLTDAVPVTKRLREIHEVEYYINLLSVLGKTDAIPRVLNVPVAPGADENLLKVLCAAGVVLSEDRPIVGICPGAAFGTAKRWLPDRFAAVSDYVSEKYKAQVVVIGSKGERPIGDEIAKISRYKIFNLCGQFPLRGGIALMDHLRLLVTNDSGNMHLAAARNVPIVAIFGPTDSRTTAPYHPNAIIVRRDTKCAPCLLRQCPPEKEHECMKAVTVDDVIEAVERQMNPGARLGAQIS